MSPRDALQIDLLAGAERLLAVHARELPQRDDLCGAFCAALALRAAGIERLAAGPVDQDLLALAAGSVVSRLSEPANLPHSEPGRRDYRLEVPFVEDPAVSGTSAGGLVEAIGSLTEDRLAAIPYSGPWTVAALDGLFSVAAELENPVTFVANLATRHLWGSHPSPGRLLAYLLEGDLEGPPPDWDVGHFVCVVGRVCGPAGNLYCVADTYPSLGSSGLHSQPRERLAKALTRPDMTAGGMIVIAFADDSEVLRSGAAAVGLIEEIWDNGTIAKAAS